MRLSPIDHATAYVMRTTAIVTDEQIEEARIILGLNKPLVIQYLNWIKHSISGDLGISLTTGKPVVNELVKAVPISLKVVGLSSIIMLIGSIVLGYLQFLIKKKRKLFELIAISLIAMPPFYVGLVYINVFNTKIKYIPAAICLSLFGIGFYSQMFFKRISQEMKSQHVFFSLSRGISEKKILIIDALPAAIIDLIPSFAQMIGIVLVGATVVEKVFSLPGFGHLIIKSVLNRDAPVIHGSVLVLAVILVVLNFLAEMIQKGFSKDYEKNLDTN
jgi:peptide/nickel transport system permease protein